MGYVLSLGEIRWRDAAAVGGKAANCARLRQAGFAVPDGVVITGAGAGRDAALAQLQLTLAHWPEDTLFAVRSSAADEDGAQHSFAGMHETQLNVAPADVAEAVRACWASMHSPRAAAYREARGQGPSESGAGVLVQEMVAARTAGVVFTRDPVSGAERVVINAVAGLGDALVSGGVQPQEWRVSLQTSNTGGSGAPAVLSEAQVQELAALARRIERLFGTPQDIEWCHDGGQFWIVQARPITAMAAAGPELEWTRANLREVLPDLPAPQVTDAVCSFLDRGQRAYGGRLWAPTAELGPTAKAFCGRPYFNLSQLRYAMRMTGRPAAGMLRTVGYSGAIAPEDEQVQPRRWGRFLRALPDFVRMLWFQLRVESLVQFHLRHLGDDLEKIWPAAIDNLPDEQVADGFDDRHIRRMLLEFRPIFALAAVVEYEGTVRKLLRSAGASYEQVALPCLAAGKKSVSAQQAFDLLRLAAAARADEHASRYFRETEDFSGYRAALAGSECLGRFDDFLERYGHRGNWESDWSLPRYAEDPSPILQAIQAHVRADSCPSAEALAQQQDECAREAWERFEARLNAWQRRALAPLVRRLLERIRRLYACRELYRSELMRQLAQRRRWHLAIAERFVQRGWIASRDDYFLLTFAEISGALGGDGADKLMEIVAQRRRELEVWRQIEMPLWLRDSDVGKLRPKDGPISTGPRLEGLCVSPGQVEAEVVVLRRPDDFGRMRPGAIIVAPATDPAWTPLFTLAAGLIVEIGGLLSHASIVAREYGLPALANVQDATRALHDGDRVRLDATGGRVEICPPATGLFSRSAAR